MGPPFAHHKHYIYIYIYLLPLVLVSTEVCCYLRDYGRTLPHYSLSTCTALRPDNVDTSPKLHHVGTTRKAVQPTQHRLKFISDGMVKVIQPPTPPWGGIAQRHVPGTSIRLPAELAIDESCNHPVLHQVFPYSNYMLIHA